MSPSSGYRMTPPRDWEMRDGRFFVQSPRNRRALVFTATPTAIDLAERFRTSDFVS